MDAGASLFRLSAERLEFKPFAFRILHNLLRDSLNKLLLFDTYMGAYGMALLLFKMI